MLKVKVLVEIIYLWKIVIRLFNGLIIYPKGLFSMVLHVGWSMNGPF